MKVAFDFSFSATLRWTFVVLNEMSQQLLKALPLNLVETFVSPSG